MDGIQFGLLGPVEVAVDGGLLPIESSQQRTMLAALLLRPGKAVPMDDLADAVWGADPPAKTKVALQTGMSRLRRSLGRAGGLIRNATNGYLITVPESAVDIWRFRAQVRLAEQAHARADAEAESSSLTAALALFRGDPLVDIDSDSLQRDFAPGLIEESLRAKERLIDAELRLGRHAQLVGQLNELTARHPLRERFWQLLINTLYRGGRQAEALEAYRAIARTLAHELGVDPGPELRAMHQTVLTGEAIPDGGATHDKRVPRQLPPPPRWFVGRGRDVATLTRTLDERTAFGRTMVVSAVRGSGGIGKTALVLHWAHQHLDRFPDGQLYVNLRGFDPSGAPMLPSTAVRGFLDTLGVRPAAIPTEPDAQAALLRSMVADRRMLVVLDNARDSAQVEPLLPGGRMCTVLVTSRNNLTGLRVRGADLLALDELTEDEAGVLFTKHVGADRVAAEPEATTRLLGWCAGLPLAIGVVAVRAADRAGIALAEVAAELRDASARLNALDGGELGTDVRAVLSWSYRALNPAAAQMFRLLGLIPEPDIGVQAAAGLAGIDPAAARDALHELESVTLLQQPVSGRFRMHDLIRLYAAEQAGNAVDRTDRESASDRLLDHYLHSAHAAERALQPESPPITLRPPAAGCVIETFDGDNSAMEWFAAEHECLLAAQRTAGDRGLDAHVWQLAWTLTSFHRRRAEWGTSLDCWRTAISAAVRLRDLTAQSVAHQNLGELSARLGRHDDALNHLGKSLELTRVTGDRVGHAYTHLLLSVAWEQAGDFSHALASARQALRFIRMTGHPGRESKMLNAVGWYQALLGRHAAARRSCERALALSREHGNRAAEAHSLDSLGYIEFHSGNNQAAIGRYREAVELFTELGYTSIAADSLDRLGDAQMAQRMSAAARESWRRATHLYRAQDRTLDAKRVERKLSA